LAVLVLVDPFIWPMDIALSVDGLPYQPRAACPSPARSIRFAPVLGTGRPCSRKWVTVLRDINHSTKEMKMTTNTKTANQPKYHAFYVIEGERGQKARWNRIGAVFSHDDGQGQTLMLDSIPIAFDGRIVMRAPKVTADGAA
jgi:hypothetical protein